MAKEGDGVLDEEERTKTLLSKAEISILLDNYDDIFSDFDPRSFTHRALSDDFLIEAKKAVKSAGEGKDTFDLSFMIPKNQRNFEHELLIKRRLREHFRKHALMIETEISEIKRAGIFLIIFGFIMLALAAIITYYGNGRFLYDLFLIILEPAGWFLFWIGGEKFVYENKSKLPELVFYQKMTRCEISFHPY